MSNAFQGNAFQGVEASPTAAEIATAVWGKSIRSLTDNPGLSLAQETMLIEIYKLMGLDPTKPLIVTQTNRTAGTDIEQEINVDEVTKTTTVQRV